MDATAPLDLDVLRWRQRLLLLFAPDAADPRYRVQLERLEPHAAALRERDLRVVHLLAAAAPGEPPREDDLIGTPADAERLRAAFADDAANAFCAVLVGKDGGAKGSWPEPVEPQHVFAMIDGMPMRRRELAQRTEE